jgi:hypothetical protein
MRWSSGPVLALAAATAIPAGAAAQGAPVPSARFGVTGHLDMSALPQTAARPGIAFLASAILPGAGQWLQDEDRWVPYVLTETWAWATYFSNRGRAADLRADYRDLAWAVARRVSVGARRDTVFEYYETLSEWQTSGAFDVDPRTDGTQPESDAGTFNGDVWRLARSLLIPGGATAPPGSPEYERALQYYREHAIPDGYAWAWGPNGLEQQRFRELIRASDDASRAATLRLGIILANHVISAVDALVIARVREAAGGDGAPALHLESAVRPDATDGWRWTAGIRIAH